jgi:nucleotide-binding universal stress UspA family protein
VDVAETMRILLAVDGSACSDAAVEAVLAHFRPDRTEVRVLHAVEWLKDLPASYRFGEGPTYARDIMAHRERSFRQSQELVTRVASQLQAAGFRTSTATPDADPRHAVVEDAANWPADLIVMGSHGRTGLDRFLLGSVAESVMRHAPCSVEIIRGRRAHPSEPHLSTTIL